MGRYTEVGPCIAQALLGVGPGGFVLFCFVLSEGRSGKQYPVVETGRERNGSRCFWTHFRSSVESGNHGIIGERKMPAAS